MGSGFKIAFWIWTGLILLAFVGVAISAMSQPTCGALSANPCPTLELMLTIGVGVVLLMIWGAGIVAALIVSWLVRWVRE